MVKKIKNQLYKISLLTKITSLFLLLTLGLALGYPILIKTLGVKLSLNTYVYGLGIKVVDEALFFTYMCIGGSLVALFIYQLYLISQTLLSLDKGRDQIQTEFEELQKKNALIKQQLDEIFLHSKPLLLDDDGNRNTPSNHNGHNHQNKTRPELLALSKVYQKFKDLQKNINDLMGQLKDNQKFGTEVINIFDNFEKKHAKKQNLEDQFDLINKKLEILQDNVFRLQFLIFNTSIEVFKCDSDDHQLPSLTSEISELIQKENQLITEIQQELEQKNKQIIKQQEDSLNKIIEIGRYVTKTLFNNHKLFSTTENINNLAKSETLDALRDKIDCTINDHHQQQLQLQLRLQQLQKLINSLIESDLEKTALIPQFKNYVEANAVTAAAMVEAKNLVPPWETTRTTTSASASTSTMAAPTTLVEALKAEAAAEVLEVEKFSETSSPATVSTEQPSMTEIIKEVMSQNIAALYSIKPEELRQAFIQQVQYSDLA